VVDHVLRYNPILRAIARLQDLVLGPPQRFLFENDASDEDLPLDHWFWDEEISGGIFVEHGVHFFDAATMLVGEPVTTIQASAARRTANGPVDMVSATARHGIDVLATHTHSFTHARRCERQLMRLDYGTAEVRVDGWIPVDAVVDLWTDDDGARLCQDISGDLLQVDGFRTGPGFAAGVSEHRDALPAPARGRGHDLTVPHQVQVRLTLGGPEAKAGVYAESVRAAMNDLTHCAQTGARPRSGLPEGADAVAVALAATAAVTEGRAVTLERIRPLSGRST
jgi:predicted dehydrogenase